MAGEYSYGPQIEERAMINNLSYMLIPVVLFGGGILASWALFRMGMKRVEEKQ